MLVQYEEVLPQRRQNESFVELANDAQFAEVTFVETVPKNSVWQVSHQPIVVATTPRKTDALVFEGEAGLEFACLEPATGSCKAVANKLELKNPVG